MPKFCIFHDRREITHARVLSTKLAQAGIPCWLADSHNIQNWRNEVDSHLNDRDYVGALVIWSGDAANNAIVLSEAEATLRAKKTLLAVVVDDVGPPLGLSNTPRVDMRGWDGAETDPRIETVIEKAARIARDGAKTASPITEIEIGAARKKLLCPAYVFSVSSFETQITPAKLVELLIEFPPAAVLVSAYDVLGVGDKSADVAPNAALLRKLEQTGATIFLDSGNYEAYRLGDVFWQSSPWVLREATARINSDITFSHDHLVKWSAAQTGRADELLRDIAAEYDRDSAATGKLISPIVHAPVLPDGNYASQVLPDLCEQVARAKRPPVIAVAERELGDGILERARRVRSIRKRLNDLPFQQPLHLLGTGNPISMMILSFAGADIFDGLEWCRTVADADTMRLHHFHQIDLFKSQQGQIDDLLLLEYLKSDKGLLSSKAKTILHNLYFFKRFAAEVQQAHQQGAYDVLFEKYLPGQFGRVNRFLEAGNP
jgi:queuine/archaeosine tRNA-ribosyltransferase